VLIPEVSGSLLNPYPLLGAPDFPTWPRGFPLEHVETEATWNVSVLTAASLPRASVGVLQSLANHQPDVDAVFRMTRKTPFAFGKSRGKCKSSFINCGR
jgi:hypothetical protein